MANYYFLSVLLPPLQIGEAPDIDLKEFEELLKENLSTTDLEKAKSIRRFYDILNLRAYWNEEPLDPMGNYDASTLEDALVERITLPRYVFKYIDRYETKQERLAHFLSLLSEFFKQEMSHSSGFLKFYFKMERELRLVLTALRAKILGRDLQTELQYEDPEEELIAQMLAQKDAPDYEPPEKYQELKTILNRYSQQPLLLQQALIEYRFAKIDEQLGIDSFSIDKILGYMVQLILVKGWQQLDTKKGMKILETLFQAQ